MRQNSLKPETAGDIARYFTEAKHPSQQETLGQIVVEILRSGAALNRPAICAKLVRRLELAGGAEEEQHYRTLIGLLFGREQAV
ncbi:regulatory protein YcgZ [Pantoea sp. GL120224-02]|uniref:regulatory protein YcgZ n=1 Tax=Pantoea sp. GL120224-02 TaxID=1378084 RepID=UPI000BD6C4DD|nr:regulatory protein YcgZ [Pantoea sp. GL120224-02]SNY66545.1 Biofilm development protein YmgB/AriR [Pantoea sp. GL120224-02]